MREVRRRRLRPPNPATHINGATQPPLSSRGAVSYHHLHTTISEDHRTRIPQSLSDTYTGTIMKAGIASGDAPQQLHYFVHGFTPLTFPTQFVRHDCDILRIAFLKADPALLHALCAVSAIHRSLFVQSTGPSVLSTESNATVSTSAMDRNFLRHKWDAVRFLRINLSQASNLDRNSTLATASLLLMIETLSGDTTAADVHKSGLLQLVRLNDEEEKPTALMGSDLLMIDIKSATSCVSKPLLSPPSEWLTQFTMLKHEPFVPCRQDLGRLGSFFLGKRLCRSLGLPLVYLFCAMRNLINALERNADVQLSRSNLDGSSFLVLEHQLLCFLSEDQRRDAEADMQLVECCCLGALLYCNLCMWNWPKRASLVGNLVSHLRRAVNRWTSSAQLPLKHLPVLLWLLTLASFASSRAEDYQWSENSLKVVLKLLNIHNGEDFRSVLSNFFYVERLMGQHLNENLQQIVTRLTENEEAADVRVKLYQA